MDKRQFLKVNRIIALVVFALSSAVYLSTIEPTTSFWDCGEFIASSYKLEVGHPPGNPSFNLFARFFTMFTDKDHAAVAVNAMSALCSSLTIFFLFLSIVHFGRRINEKRGKEMTLSDAIAIFGAGFVGSMAYCFSDTFWFSAVEGEVYAMSSLFTAVVFWAILKWEEQADEMYSNRWLVLICFLMGVSIGVHLLNLLTIPAIVFIYYFKKTDKPVTFKSCFKVLCISGIILAVILFGIIPYLPQCAAFTDRIFVNGFGLGFNSGAAFFMIVLFALCFWGMRVLRKKGKVVLHTILLCFTTIVIGYSIFAISIIRSSAGTPTNEYQPDNPYTLIRYLGREQYGKNPILYGQAFTSPYDIEETEYYTPLDGKYYKATNVDAAYPSSVKMFFPRMWNGYESSHKKFYEGYCNGYNKKKAVINGRSVTVQMPRFVDNLKFFFDYQVNYMYVRYFLWNFVGRQNDFHGQTPGNLISGNWESGITFLDNARLGDQSEGPDFIVNNESKNHYYFLPLLLGLAGLFFQLKYDGRNTWVVSLLFVLTGLAIVVYLNQPPYQVRERDYAYAGSFYVFTIWIGLGVMAVQEWLNKLLKKDSSIAAASVAVALSLVVPVLMGCENWDDHDRSGRYTARDVAYNYLNSCGENAMLVTHGDNDTFPLWYAQEVEGIRTDIRIVNTSLLGTDWYIDQMKHRFYDSAPLNISIGRKQYLYGTNDYVPVMDVVDYPILASDAIAVFRNPKYVASDGSDYLPARQLVIPVNAENALKSGIVSPENADKIEPQIVLNITEDHLSKSDLILLDILSSYDWSRPFCFISRLETKLGLENYLQCDGFCYKIMPYRNPDSNSIAMYDGELLYEKIMNTFRFESLADTTIHVDYQNLYTFCAVSPIRDIFVNAAEALMKSGEKEKAVEVLDKCIAVIPEKNFPYNMSFLSGMNEWIMLNIVEDYFKLGEDDKAKNLGMDLADATLEAITYYGTIIGPEETDVLSKKHLEDCVTIYYYICRLFSTFGHQDLTESLNAKLESL